MEHSGHMHFIAMKLREDLAAHIAHELAANIEPKTAARLLLCVRATPKALKMQHVLLSYPAFILEDNLGIYTAFHR